MAVHKTAYVLKKMHKKRILRMIYLTAAKYVDPIQSAQITSAEQWHTSQYCVISKGKNGNAPNTLIHK
jgi:hypothetical protein